MLVKLDHFPKDPGENYKIFELPPPSFDILLNELHLKDSDFQGLEKPMFSRVFQGLNGPINLFFEWIFQEHDLLYVRSLAIF